jgi:hypothetical protein
MEFQILRNPNDLLIMEVKKQLKIVEMDSKNALAQYNQNLIVI